LRKNRTKERFNVHQTYEEFLPHKNFILGEVQDKHMFKIIELTERVPVCLCFILIQEIKPNQQYAPLSHAYYGINSSLSCIFSPAFFEVVSSEIFIETKKRQKSYLKIESEEELEHI
jgi:hypothetical protein